MSDLLRVHDFVRLAKQHGFDMWYDPAIRLWILMNDQGEAVEYFTRAVLRKMGFKRFAKVYLGVEDGYL